MRIAIRSVPLDTNPYAPPQVESTLRRSLNSPPNEQVTKRLLLGYTLAIGVITLVFSSSSNQAIYSPYPWAVLIPVYFFRIPIGFVCVAASFLFILSQHTHFRGVPRARPTGVLAVFMVGVTALTFLKLLTGWPTATAHPGIFYCVAITLANLLLAGGSWYLCWTSNKPHHHRQQVHFGFAVWAWTFSYAVPTMNDF